jgi:hypothetical protein
VRELRLRGIGAPAAANPFLREEFIAELNQRFRVPAARILQRVSGGARPGFGTDSLGAAGARTRLQ